MNDDKKDKPTGSNLVYDAEGNPHNIASGKPRESGAERHARLQDLEQPEGPWTRADAIRVADPMPLAVADRLMKRYTELFPNYVWTDSATALDLMAAEITTMREELHRDKERHARVIESLHDLIERKEDERTKLACAMATLGDRLRDQAGMRLSSFGTAEEFSNRVIKAVAALAEECNLFRLHHQEAVAELQAERRQRDAAHRAGVNATLSALQALNKVDIINLLSILDTILSYNEDANVYALESDDAAIVDDIRTRWGVATQKVDVSGASATMQAGGEPRRGQDLPDAAPLSVPAEHDLAVLTRREGNTPLSDLHPLCDCRESVFHRVVAEVAARRSSQDAEHGGPKHDDTHDPCDWTRFIVRFVRRAEDHVSLSCDEPTVEGYENALIDVAALAVAAIQSSRRKRGV